MTPEREIGLDPLLHRRHTQAFEPSDLGLGERLERELGQRRSTPEAERFVQGSRRTLGIALCERIPPLAEPALEAVQVELGRLDREQVAGRAGQQSLRGQQLAQPRDVDLQALHRGFGRLVAPELVDQTIARQDVVCVHEEQRKQRALLGARERQQPLPVMDLERTQDPVLHRRLLQADVY